jgi:L-ascorbate metabolism protein UlaG (beta-lactamase superfamily)
LDPFVDDNPLCPVKSDDLTANFLLITHGHYDHMADAEKIAKQTGALVIAIFEICDWLEKRGVARTHPMNLGGKFRFPFGDVKLVPALHSSTMPDGAHGGAAGGFVLFLPEGNVYFAGDTALFGDMKFIGDLGLALAVLPIGDNFTMGPEDALIAVKLLRPRRVVPMHTGTWPVIDQDPEAWAERVRKEGGCDPIVLRPGEWLDL